MKHTGSDRNWRGTAKIGTFGRRALRGGREGTRRTRQLEQVLNELWCLGVCERVILKLQDASSLKKLKKLDVESGQIIQYFLKMTILFFMIQELFILTLVKEKSRSPLHPKASVYLSAAIGIHLVFFILGNKCSSYVFLKVLCVWKIDGG